MAGESHRAVRSRARDRAIAQVGDLGGVTGGNGVGYCPISANPARGVYLKHGPYGSSAWRPAPFLDRPIQPQVLHEPSANLVVAPCRARFRLSRTDDGGPRADDTSGPDRRTAVFIPDRVQSTPARGHGLRRRRAAGGPFDRQLDRCHQRHDRDRGDLQGQPEPFVRHCDQHISLPDHSGSRRRGADNHQRGSGRRNGWNAVPLRDCRVKQPDELQYRTIAAGADRLGCPDQRRSNDGGPVLHLNQREQRKRSGSGPRPHVHDQSRGSDSHHHQHAAVLQSRGRSLQLYDHRREWSDVLLRNRAPGGPLARLVLGSHQRDADRAAGRESRHFCWQFLWQQPPPRPDSDDRKLFRDHERDHRNRTGRKRILLRAHGEQQPGEL